MAQESNSTSKTKATKRKRMTHEERTELSDSKMFEATKALILEVGTHKTTLKEVGEKAGYSRGLANSRFGNKDTLFLKLEELCRQLWIAEMRAASEGKYGLEALISRLDATIAYATHYPDEAMVMYVLWFESVGSSSEMKHRLVHFHQQARRDIEALLKQAKAAGDIPQTFKSNYLAESITSMIFGLVYQFVVNKEAINITASVEAMKLHIIAMLKS